MNHQIITNRLDSTGEALPSRDLYLDRRLHVVPNIGSLAEKFRAGANHVIAALQHQTGEEEPGSFTGSRYPWWAIPLQLPRITDMGSRVSTGLIATSFAAGLVAAVTVPRITMTTATPKSVGRLDFKQSLGKALFMDASLSEPPGQSCASCHDPETHFANPRHSMIAEGAVAGRFGNRKPPSIAYASYSPDFHYDPEKKDYLGGYFWDGRAKTLKDQAKGPLLNPAEMNNTSRRQVVGKVARGALAEDFQRTYGEDIFEHPDKAFDAIADAISDYERSLSPRRRQTDEAGATWPQSL